MLLNQDRLFFNFDSKCHFDVNLKTDEITGANIQHENIEDFIFWLLEDLDKEAEQFLNHPKA